MSTYLVTGGCGFIGSNFVLQEIAKGNKVINLDSMSYAANEDNVKSVMDHPLYHFVKGDICDQALIGNILREHKVDSVIHFAAESHVDNSISGPEVFMTTNIMGTYHMLWASLLYWREQGMPVDFRFIHISTDEVFGDLPLNTAEKFTETTNYKPSSPYSASKAGSDHIARAWQHTYGLPVIVTNCSNNYGPRQNKEKLIPNMIRCALQGKNLPVYGTGENVRDWIHVEDHCRGIALALEKGEIGRSYCFGGNAERKNIDVVHLICDALDNIRPRSDGQSYRSQISFVADRMGHDLRYAIDDTRARTELGYSTDKTFEALFADTVKWYVDHEYRLS
jgi:dTDP-glucose 4,6-dehydratase